MNSLRSRLVSAPLAELMVEAASLRDEGFGKIQSYSPKVFIPLTKLCRNVCHYCTFAQAPRRGSRAYLTENECLAIASAGRAQGCTEALFTLGDKPEFRYQAAQAELAELGHNTTVSYLAAVCEAVLNQTGLLPHVNAGVMDSADLSRLRSCSASQGLMLESCSERLLRRGQAHFGSPDKHPRARLDTIEKAGAQRIPFTSGILIGIGETREERIEALIALRALNERWGHIQEIIVQSFQPKASTRMASVPAPSLEDLLWTIAAARLIFGPAMSIQSPPNLRPNELKKLIEAGVNDWGGVSPVTPDHVNPEAPWPSLIELRHDTAKAGRVLTERLAVAAPFVREYEQWLHPNVAPFVLRHADASGMSRNENWRAGAAQGFSVQRFSFRTANVKLASILERAADGERLCEAEIAKMFDARGADFDRIVETADALRDKVCGDTVSYIVNRNINYTNVCAYACTFCAFSKGRGQSARRGRAYDLDLAEVARRAAEAEARGAVEVCMQGGIHPDYNGFTYLALLDAVRQVAPKLHVHAFSPLEVWHGAQSLGLSLTRYLSRLKDAGLGSLPGTSAEILDDSVRAVLCPDKLTTEQWLHVIECAHEVGLRTTGTIMFGHVDGSKHWAAHLLRIRDLQARTGGFTEFVPLPFVHEEAPIFLQRRSRPGPTVREVMLMHAVARLALHPLIENIQTSWPKIGADGAAACLAAGANDLGGTLMNESISSAAGAVHGQEMPPERMETIIRALGRAPRQRTTLYADASELQKRLSYRAAPLGALVQTPVRKRHRSFSEGGSC